MNSIKKKLDILEDKLTKLEQERPGAIIIIFILGLPIFVPMFMIIINKISQIFQLIS
jgi:hypothetical protein